MQLKYLFIDRDGTLIDEPPCQQIDSLEKLKFKHGVFNALEKFLLAGYRLVIVSNQDGLGTDSFPKKNFEIPQEMMISIFKSQGIKFDAVHICPHFAHDLCQCRKPNTGLIIDYFIKQTVDKENSYVIGDRDTDLQLAEALGISGLKIGSDLYPTWQEIGIAILSKPRQASWKRKTKETEIFIELNLESSKKRVINTGVDFFDHMLEQLVQHAGISAEIRCHGDISVDCHHTVEDTGLALGQALRQALGDKRGIARYGFVLPMDEAKTSICLDLSGRSFCQYIAKFNREQIGGLATEMIPHFFRSFADGLKATMHLEITGENTHHMIESSFKALGRCLRQALQQNKEAINLIPSTKGVL